MTTTSKPEFSSSAMALVQKIIKRYPEGRQKSALLPVLHLAQAEFGGWLSPETMDYVASILDLTPIEVYEVASFYSMYNLRPVGKCLLEVCRTGPCMLRGSDDIIEYLENKLGIRVGETTPDGMFTLKTVECLASCGTAPMMQVGEHYIENLSCEKLDGILEELRGNGDRIQHAGSGDKEIRK
jgi:NADH-quinone oxidoreductase subunit E